MKTNCSKRSHNDIATSMKNPEGALRAFHALSFEMAGTDANDDILISAWKVSLNNEIQPLSGKVRNTVDDEANIEHESRPTDTNSAKMERSGKEGKAGRKGTSRKRAGYNGRRSSG